MPKYRVLAGLVVGLLAAIATHLCSQPALAANVTTPSDYWHIQAAIDAAGTVLGFVFGMGAADSAS